jgi:hypothetical protein
VRRCPRCVGNAAHACAAFPLTSGAVALGGTFLLERWNGASVEQLPALLVMLLGLPLMAMTEVLLHASMGQRKMGAQVAIRDTLVPVLWLVSALGFHALGLASTGLSCCRKAWACSRRCYTERARRTLGPMLIAGSATAITWLDYHALEQTCRIGDARTRWGRFHCADTTTSFVDRADHGVSHV